MMNNRWMTTASRAMLLPFAAAAGFLVLTTDRAAAVPSYARQTGLACEACHTVFPELTPFGRRFKLNGYLINNREQISATSERRKSLALSFFTPLSAMFVASYTHTASAQPDSNGQGNAQNGTSAFPQQLSLFYAGEITPNIGSFIQLTYDPSSGSIGMDNTDIRYADSVTFAHGDKLNWGISLNNNPTVQDLWNTVPAWFNPYMTSAAARTPDAATLIDQGLAGNAGGLTAYAMLNDTWYAEAGVYTSVPQGTGQPYDTAAMTLISGAAPYWRLAGEWDWGQNSFEVGSFGMAAKTRFAGNCSIKTQLTDSAGNPVDVYTTAPGPCQTLSSGPTDDYVDVALDTQYQYITDLHEVTFAGSWIHEMRKLSSTISAFNIANGTAITAGSTHLDTARASLSYFYRRTIGGSVDVFDSFGSAEPLIYGSLNNKPDSNGITVEADYLPWLNTKLGVAYTHYMKFNGASHNYDGLGTNASDNDTLYAYFWFAF